MDIEEQTHDYWLLCLQGRDRLPVYKLNREDLRKCSLNHLTAQGLLDSVRYMPSHLAHQVIEAIDVWKVSHDVLVLP